MKRVILAVVSTVAALVMLLSFKSHGLSASASPPEAVSSGSASSGSGSTTGSGSTSSSGSTTSSGAARTYTGAAAQTRYGPVQVQVTVTSGKITGVSAIEYPNRDPRDAQINAYAIPSLNAEAKSANGATIDMISGATFTSEGYLTSLQSALDKAGL